MTSEAFGYVANDIIKRALTQKKNKKLSKKCIKSNKKKIIVRTKILETNEMMRTKREKKYTNNDKIR